MAERTEKVDFDAYAERYETLVAEQVGFFSERSYFSEYKVRLLRDYLPNATSILDFGCGIGLSLPHFQKHFPSSKIFATDVSSLSLGKVREHHPRVATLPDAELEDQRYDLIFLSCVIHHVEPAERPPLFARLAGLLATGGTLAVFEHNPYNPVTQRLVSTCEFDADAQLISRRRLGSLIEHSSPLKVWRAGYTLFVPNQFAFARPLERYLHWLPLGGQYVVLAR